MKGIIVKKNIQMLNYQHQTLGIKGILVIVLLCFSFAMSAAPLSSSTWKASALNSSNTNLQTSFRSTSTGMYQSNHSTYRPTQSSYRPSQSTYNNGTWNNQSTGYNTQGYSTSNQLSTTSSAKMHTWGGYNNASSGYSYVHNGLRKYNNDTRVVIANNRRRNVDILAAQPSYYNSAIIASNKALQTKRDIYTPGLSEERDDTNGNGIDEYYDDELGDYYDLPSGDPGLGVGAYVGQTGIGGDGKQYVWNGSQWVLSPKNVAPIGSTPYLLILLMIAAYCFYRKRKHA